MFNLNWFKTKKKEEELLDLQIKREKLITDSLEKTLKDQESKKVSSIQSKLYKKLKFVNDVLTVIFNDGSVINKSQATVNDFSEVRNAFTEDDIIDIMRGKEIKNDILDDVMPPTNDAIQIVCQFPDFEMAEECIYMNGINRSLPPLLIKRFGEIIGKYDKGEEEAILNDVEYISLKKFWLKCCLNPNAQSAEDLYTFLSHHNMKIDRHGNFFAYRRVCKVDIYVDKSLIDTISRVYNNIKAVWKKNPANYEIFNDNGYVIVPHDKQNHGYNNHVGNLKDLYLDLPNMTENRYTDSHTHSMDYRVGQIASIPRHECDDDNAINCSKGLHCASKQYDYSGFGDTPILMIVNPCDAVAVPLNEIGKLRVARWFFAMTLAEEDKHILDDDDFDVTELGDIFEEKCLANIEQHVHTSFTEEVQRHTFTIPQMSNINIKSISSMLRDMNDAIKNRIVNQ